MENNSIEGESNTLKKPDKHISILASSFGTEENNWFDAEVPNPEDLKQSPIRIRSVLSWIGMGWLARSPNGTDTSEKSSGKLPNPKVHSSKLD